MAERVKSFKQKYGVRIIIVVLSMLFLCTFIIRKEGYHMDEILAFQLANAEYNPWIVPTQPVGRLAKFMAEHIDGESLGETISNIGFIVKDTLINRGSSILANYNADVYDAPAWISRDRMQAYVQCDSGDDYNLLSVYFNVKDDNHPPLHFMLLHIMTSLFKGEISAWHGCVINLAAMAGTLWLLGLIGDMIFQKKSSIYATMILYGFSMGIVGTTIWIRMYALLTLWTAWGLYLHLRKYVGRERVSSVSILIVTVLSFWTQYFGLFFMLPLAFITVIYLWKEKRIKDMWAYVRTMIIAAIIGVGLFPFAVGDVLFSDRGTEALSQWQNGLGEYWERLKAFGSILAENVAANSWLFTAAVCVPVLVLISRSLYCVKVKKQKVRMVSGKELWQFIMLAVPTIVYFMLAAKMSPYFVDRYIMAIFPMVALFILWLWEKALEAAGWRCSQAAVCMGLAVLVSAVQFAMMQGGHPYLYKGYEEQITVAESYAEYPLVCLYSGYGFYENIVEMERYEQTMLVKSEELAQMDAERTAVTSKGYVILIKYPGIDAGKDKLTEVMEVFGGSEAGLLYEGGAFGDVIYLVTP